MTKPLRQFWLTLDELPGAATDRRDWMARLGEGFPAAQRYLRKTGRRATAIDCPSPGGEGCPRAVIRNAAGAFRAVCRSVTGRCDPVALDSADLDILELDAARLQQDLAVAFAVQAATAPSRVARVVHLGEHGVAAGFAAPVLLVLPGPGQPLAEEELRYAGLGAERSVVLAPSAASLPASLRSRLSEHGHRVLHLSDIVAIEHGGGLRLVQPVDVLLHDVRAALEARLGAASPGPRVALPPGTTWGQVTLRCTSNATVICTAPGVSRQMDPGEFGMRSAKNAKPTAAWTFFLLLATKGGVLRIDGAGILPSVRKQKEALSRHLQETFCIRSDPVSWDPRQQAYVAAFVARDERQRGEREQWLRDLAQRRRR